MKTKGKMGIWLCLSYGNKNPPFIGKKEAKETYFLIKKDEKWKIRSGFEISMSKREIKESTWVCNVDDRIGSGKLN